MPHNNRTYKVLGELAAADGTGMLGHNTAGSGTAIGVEGVTDSPSGYGLHTPDDARVAGNMEVGTSLVGSGIVGTNNLASGAVTSTEIQDGTVSTGDLAQNGATDGHVLKWNGTDWAAGFPGTSNDNPFQLLANGNRALEVEEKTDSILSNETLNVVGGYNTNSASAAGVTIGGGGSSGGSNTVSADYGTVSGGEDNHAEANHATVGGGLTNSSKSEYGTISGGYDNAVTGRAGAVGGGQANAAEGTYATIAGGQANGARGDRSTVSGGSSNDSNGNLDAIGGGRSNRTGTSGTTETLLATIPGGEGNVATGKYSFAAGNQAEALHDGAFVWSDSGGGTQSQNPDEVRFGASGGFFIESLPSGTGAPVEWDTGSRELVIETSSARYKSDIRPIATDTEAVLDLTPRAFEFSDTDETSIGLVAEEVAEILPEIVLEDEDGRPEAVQYNRLGVFLVPEVDEHRDRLDDLEETAAEHETTVEDLEADLAAKDDRIEDQRARIDRLESRVDAKAERVDALEEQIEQKEDRIDVLEAENERLRDGLATIEDHLGLEDAAGATSADD